jgi:hypothetical protein
LNAFNVVATKEESSSMNLEVIVAELKKERDSIDRAIAALDRTGTERATVRRSRAATTKTTSTTPPGAKKGHLTAAGRKRLSELMKARWAARRRKAGNGRKSAAKAA